MFLYFFFWNLSPFKKMFVCIHGKWLKKLQLFLVLHLIV